jgi:uncharacterized protein YndB with AHSA1/START domain
VGDRKPVPSSFEVEQEVSIDAPRERVWEALVDVAGWWCHHETQTRGTLVLEPKVGGRFYERFGPAEGRDEAGALWGTVTWIQRPETLRLSGPLGMDLPATNVWQYDLVEHGRSTTLRLVQRCVGLIDPEMPKAYDGGWKALWVHLKALAEKGVRYGG